MRKSSISGKLEAFGPSTKREVWIFYSSEKEPEIPSAYAMGMDYLRESKIKSHIIDINRNPGLAEKHKIMATPAIIIKKGKESHEFVGMVDGLRELLAADISGKSILHLMGFKEGRELASRLKIPKEMGKMEAALKSALRARGVYDFRLMGLEPDKYRARIRLSSDFAKGHKKSKAPACFEVSAMLGGIFTEIFDRGVIFEELGCMACGDNYCEFQTKEGKEGKNRGN